MCVCVCVCVCLCVCLCVCICMCVYACVCICKCVHAYAGVRFFYSTRVSVSLNDGPLMRVHLCTARREDKERSVHVSLSTPRGFLPHPLSERKSAVESVE